MYNGKNTPLGTYVCIGKCPELDGDVDGKKSPRCTHTVSNYIALMKLLKKQCCCGNIAKWEKK